MWLNKWILTIPKQSKNVVPLGAANRIPGNFQLLYWLSDKGRRLSYYDAEIYLFLEIVQNSKSCFAPNIIPSNDSPLESKYT